MIGGLLVATGTPDHSTSVLDVEGEAWANEIVVRFDPTTPAEDIAELSRSAGIVLRPNSAYSSRTGIHVASVPASRRAAVLQVLRASPLVGAAEPNWTYKALWVPNDPNYADQWHLHQIGMEDAWDVTRGKGAIVAVLDTGVASANTAQGIQIRDLKETSFADGYDFVDDDDIAQELGGHGSHVAGTIAQSTDNGVLGAGVAPEATIVPVRVLSPVGGSAADIAEGIQFAVDQGAHVINMSLGGGPYSQVFHTAIQDAVAAGTTVICAAGNTGREGVEYPARYPEAIAISAVGPSGDLAPYSTWGKEIDLAAPGGDTRQPGGGVLQNTFERGQDVFVGYNGTSMAAPHVAGVAALLVSLGVEEPDEIRRILKESTSAKGSPDQYGAGLLDANEAVSRAAGSGRTQRGRLTLMAALGALLVATGMTREGARRTTRRRLQWGLAFAGGMVIPDLVEWAVGFGSLLNLAGHSVLPAAAIAVVLTRRGRRDLAPAVALGVALHLAGDAWNGDSPFLAASWRRAAWLWINVAIALWPVLSELYTPRTLSAGGKSGSTSPEPAPA